MASTIIKRIQDYAEGLYNLRQEISKLEEENKVKLDALKVERDAVQALLMADMEKNSLSSLKVKSGDSFSLSTRKGIEVVDEAHALKWSMDNYAVSINKVLVAQKLKDVEELPKCFKAVETKFISVRKAKE